MSDNSQAADPNAGASTAENAPAADTGSSAVNAPAENGASLTSANSATGSTAPSRVAVHLESIYSMVSAQHAAMGAARSHAIGLLQAFEHGVEMEAHEIADSLRRLIGML